MAGPQTPTEQPPNKQKQQRARKTLSDFLTRLRKACDTISTINDWVEIAGELNGILGLYQAEIPGSNRQRLTEALELTETSREAVSQACDILQLELQKTIDALPKGGCSCGCLALSALLGLAAAAFLIVGALVLFSQPVEVIVINEGCRPFLVQQGVPPGFQPAISLLGIELPEVIPPGEQGGFEIPGLPVSVGVDGSGGRSVRISGLGVSQTFDVSADVVFIELDGEPVLGSARSVRIRDQDLHTVLIICE